MDNNLDNIAVGERIRSIREKMSMSREKFSEAINISEVFLGQIERGESSLSLKTLTSIISFTGASSDYILFGDEKNNSKISKIVKILLNSSDKTIDLVYNIVNDIYFFNKNK